MMNDNNPGGLSVDDPRQQVPPGYRINPDTGQLEPIPGANPTPLIPLQPGQTRDPVTGAVIGPAVPGTPPYVPGSGSNVGLPGVDGLPIQPSVAGAVTPPPVSGPAPGTSGVGNQTAPDIFNSPLTAPYPQTFTASPPAIPGIPTFTGANAPPTFSAPAFTPPSLADLMSNPAYAGYQFGQQQGMNGIQNAAAAKGTLNDSSTFKALSDYNTGNAEQYAGGIYNQALNTYDTNLNSQYVMPYQANYTNWLQGIVNPTMTAYGAQNAQANTNYQDIYSQFLNNQNYYTNWQNNVWNKLFQSATA